MATYIDIDIEEHIHELYDQTLVRELTSRLGKEQTVDLIIESMSLSIVQVDMLKTFLKGINSF